MKIWKFYMFLYGAALLIPALIGITAYYEYYYTVNTYVFAMKQVMSAFSITMSLAVIINFITVCIDIFSKLDSLTKYNTRLKREIEKLEYEIKHLRR